jgi:hypothetical protein
MESVWLVNTPLALIVRPLLASAVCIAQGNITLPCVRDGFSVRHSSKSSRSGLKMISSVQLEHKKLGILNISRPYRPPRPVTGQLYFMETECASCEVRTGL